MRKYISESDLPKIKDDLATQIMSEWGALPANYTRCSYLESTGVQYIQTNIVPNQDTRIICDFEVLDVSSPAPLFGARVGVTENAFGVWVECNENSEGHIHVCPQYGSVSYSEYHIEMDPKQRLLINMHSTGATVNLETSVWERSQFSTGSRLTIFSMCSSDKPDTRRAVGRLRSFRVYENGLLSLFLLPVINADGEAGMFDKVANEFYGNAGEGVFVAG